MPKFIDDQLVLDAEWLKEADLQSLFEALSTDGAYPMVVGGAVRNTLEDLPVKDIDLAIDVEPEETIRLLEKAGIKAVPTGIEYGTITAVINKKPYQITSLRQDIETYGRKADVGFVKDWEADARRRDFTMNAIYADAAGRMYDPFNGIGDIDNGDVKFIGDPEERVKEDYLRILRFFRFSCEFSPYYLDPEGLDACHKYADKLATLSNERITEEFFKILELTTPSDVLTEMGPELRELFSCDLNIRALLRLEYYEAVWQYPISPLFRLAVLIDDFDDITLLQLSKSQAIFLKTMLAHKGQSSLNHKEYLYNHGADITHALLTAIIVEDPERLHPRMEPMLLECESWIEKKFPLKGDDLMKMGIPHGRELGAMLEKVERWWIRKEFEPDREACIEYAKRLMEKAEG